MTFKIGDYVTRDSYNNDIVFVIVDIKNDEVNLSFKNIKAFYMNSNNEFNLMIKEG